MPKVVEIEGVGTVEFPDEMPQEEMDQAISDEVIPRHQKRQQLVAEQEQVRGEDKFARWFGQERILPPIFLPPEDPRSIEGLARAAAEISPTLPVPIAPGVNIPLPAEKAGQLVGSAARAGEEMLAGMTQPSMLPLAPLAVVPPVGKAMALYFGAGALGAGAGELSEALPQGDPEAIGRALAQTAIGASMVAPAVVPPGVRVAPVVRRGAKPPPLPVRPRVEAPEEIALRATLPPPGTEPTPGTAPHWGVTGPRPGPPLPPRPRPVVPEGGSPARPSFPEEIRAADARTIAQIQALWPERKLSREEARVLRDIVWGKPQQPPTPPVEPPIEGAGAPAPPPPKPSQPPGRPAEIPKVREWVLAELERRGWDTNWPFAPAELERPAFVELIKMDPELSPALKAKILSFAPGGPNYLKVDISDIPPPPPKPPPAQPAAPAAPETPAELRAQLAAEQGEAFTAEAPKPAAPAAPKLGSGYIPPPLELFAQDPLAFREASKQSELSFFKSLGLSKEQAKELSSAYDLRSTQSADSVVKTLSPEARERLALYETGEGRELYQFDRLFDPREVASLDKGDLQTRLVEAAIKGDPPRLEMGDRLAFLVLGLRRFKELGGTWKDISKELWAASTGRSGSVEQATDYFSKMVERFRTVARTQNIDMPMEGAAPPSQPKGAPTPPTPVGLTPEALRLRLRDSQRMLAADSKRAFGKGQLDLARGQLVSEDGTWKLQYYPPGSELPGGGTAASKGSVLIEKVSTTQPKGAPDALKDIETAKVHEPVPAQPGEGPGQVPAAEGRVRVPPPPEAGGEVPLAKPAEPAAVPQVNYRDARLDPIRANLHRLTYMGGKWDYEIFQNLSKDQREAVDQWLVDSGHPLAQAPGTQESRVLAVARELAKLEGEGKGELLPELAGVAFLDIPADQWTPTYVRQQVARGNRKGLVSQVMSTLKLEGGKTKVTEQATEATLLKGIREILALRAKAKAERPAAPPAPEPQAPAPAAKTEEVAGEKHWSQKKPGTLTKEDWRIFQEEENQLLADTERAAIDYIRINPVEAERSITKAEGKEAFLRYKGLADKFTAPEPASPAVAVQAAKPTPPAPKPGAAPTTGTQQKRYLLAEAQKALAEAPEEQRTLNTEADRDMARFAQAERESKKDEYSPTNPDLLQAKVNDLYAKYNVSEVSPEYKGQRSISGEWARKPEPEAARTAESRLSELEEKIKAAQFQQGDNIVIDVPGDGTFVIRNSKSAIRDFLERAKKFPTTVAKAPEPKGARMEPAKPPRVETARTLETDLGAVRGFTSDDPHHFVLQYALSDGKHLVATDGRKMIIVDRKGPGTEEHPVFFNAEGKQSKVPSPDPESRAKYPTWTQVDPDLAKYDVWFKGLDTERAFRLLKQALSVISEKEGLSDVILFRDAKGNLGISAADHNIGDYASGISASSERVVTLGADHLLTLVESARKLGAKTVDVLGQDDLSPIVMRGEGFREILMPVRSSGPAIRSPTAGEMPPGPGAASPSEFRERFERRRAVPPDVPPPPPTAPPESRAELPSEQSIRIAVARKDVMPGRDWIASPEFEFRKDPVAQPLVSRLVEADLSWRSKAGQAEQRIAKAWEGLSKKEQVTVTKALRENMQGRPELLNALDDRLFTAASEVRKLFDEVREVIIADKRANLMASLPEARAGAVHDILNGLPEADAFKAHKLRAAGQKAVREAVAEMEAISHWGPEDYITNIERGSYRVVRQEITEDKVREVTVAVGETRSAAAAKAKEYLDKHPDVEELVITDEFNPNIEFPTKLTRGQYFRLVSKLRNATGEAAKDIERMLRREGKIVVIKPTEKFAGPLQKRYDILQGEENLMDVMPLYLSSVYKKLTLDPVLKEARNVLPKVAPNTRAQLEELITDVRGRYGMADQIADHLLSPLGGKPFATSRGVSFARNIVANLKLGYRPVAAAVNRLGGISHTWVKTSTQAIREGRKYMHTPEFKELWKEYAPLVGADPAAFIEGVHPTVQTKWWQPLRMFQYAEKVNRPEAFASHLWWAKNKLGLSGGAAVEHALAGTRFGQFVYSVGSLPRALRTAPGRLLGQFKTYFVKEMEFLSTLRGVEIPKYLASFLALGGPRAYVYFLRSLPVLGALGILRELDEWLNREFPKASRGVGGALGVDVTAAVTPQAPREPKDWLGPTLSDGVALWDDVISPALRGESKGWSDLGEWGAKLSPALLYWTRLVNAISKDEGWVTDVRGRPVYQLTSADRAKLLLGAKPLQQAVGEAERRYLYDIDRIERANRQRVLDRLASGDRDPKLIQQARDMGITLQDVKAARVRQQTPANLRTWKRLLRSTRAKAAPPTEHAP